MKKLAYGSLRWSLYWVLLALATPTFAAAPVTIRIASPDISAGPKPSYGGQVDLLYTRRMLEQEFQADGIKVQWSFFKGAGPAINEAFANGQVDFAFVGDLPLIIGRASGLDTRLLLALSRGIVSYLAVTPESGINSIRDLKGKRVGLLRGTADQLAFASVLASQGLSERDVRIDNLDVNAVNSALLAKQIDATWATSRLLALRDRGIVRLPVSSRDLNGTGSLQGAFVGAQPFLAAYPDIATRVVKVVVSASHWLSQESNREEQVKLVSEQSSYPLATVAESLRGADLAFLYCPLLDKQYVDNFRRDIGLAKQYGIIRKTFDVDAWIDDRYLRAALRQLGLETAWHS